jgi:hypothetical protein
MRDERILLPLFLAAMAGCAFGWFFQVRDGYGFIVYLSVVLVSAFAVYPYFAKRAAGTLTIELYVTALAAKIAASAARYWTIIDLYGSGDAMRYDAAGGHIAETLRLGEYAILDQWRVGTTAVEFLTGFSYAILPQSLEGVFLLFSFLAFLGSCFFLLAFRAAFPERDPGAYAAVVLFLPSILFWPASLGKDAVTYMGFGVIAYGVARQWVSHAPHGILYVAAGVAPIVMVRPHSAGIFVVAAGIAALWSLFGTTRGMFTRIAGILLIGILGYYVFQVNAAFLLGSEVEELTTTKAVEFYERRKVSARSGGSAVDMPTELQAFSPLYVVVTVLFRPFPWEARSPAMAVTALENIFFLWFFVSRGKVLWANLKLSRQNMLLALCVFLSLGIMAFQSGTGNLGLISRQRVQFLPYLFMLFM